MPISTFPITLENAFMLSPKVKHFIFKCDNTPPFEYIPGQFITVHFEKDGKILRRSYSIANPPEKNNRIEFAAGYVENGPGTELLFNLKPGDKININGPFGRLICKNENLQRHIFIGTSTGITPYRSMLPILKKKLATEPHLKVIILQGVQKREEVLYNEEFQNLANEFPEQVTFKPCLSRVPENELLAGEFSGYVQMTFPKLDLDVTRDMIYLCGNPGMIDEAYQYLTGHEFTAKQIVREKYISR